jgi:hypothetical protein
VATALVPSPVVDPDDACRRGLAAVGRVALEVAQHRVVALRQAEAGQQTLRRKAAGGMTEQSGKFGDPAGPPGRAA